jgi:hypothetical protein
MWICLINCNRSHIPMTMPFILRAPLAYIFLLSDFSTPFCAEPEAMFRMRQRLLRMYSHLGDRTGLNWSTRVHYVGRQSRYDWVLEAVQSGHRSAMPYKASSTDELFGLPSRTTLHAISLYDFDYFSYPQRLGARRCHLNAESFWANAAHRSSTCFETDCWQMEWELEFYSTPTQR